MWMATEGATEDQFQGEGEAGLKNALSFCTIILNFEFITQFYSIFQNLYKVCQFHFFLQCTSLGHMDSFKLVPMFQKHKQLFLVIVFIAGQLAAVSAITNQMAVYYYVDNWMQTIKQLLPTMTEGIFMIKTKLYWLLQKVRSKRRILLPYPSCSLPRDQGMLAK